MNELDKSPPLGAKKTRPHCYTAIVSGELIEVEDMGPNTIPRYASTDNSGRTFFRNQLQFVIMPPSRHKTINDPSVFLQLI